MKSKSNWLIILIGMIIAFIYICISCIFYMKFNEALTQISEYQVEIMKSGLSIQKLIIISCLFIVFITIFFISVLVNMGVKIHDFKSDINILHSQIINAEIQNHKKEIESQDKECEKNSLKDELKEYKKLRNHLHEFYNSIRNEITEIEKLLSNIKSQRDKQFQNVSMFIKASEDGIRSTEEIYNNVTFFYNNESKLQNLNLKIDKLKEMAKEAAINASIENTKIKNKGADSKELLFVSDVSLKLSEKSNSISKDMEQLKKEVNDKADEVLKAANNIKKIYVTQGNISKETKNQFDVLTNGLDEALKRIHVIVNQFLKMGYFDNEK